MVRVQREFELSRVRVTEGKITVEIQGKLSLIRVSERFELARVDCSTVCGVLCVFVMMSTNIKKNSAVSEEGHVLTAYGFYPVVSLASMQIKSF